MVASKEAMVSLHSTTLAAWTESSSCCYITKLFLISANILATSDNGDLFLSWMAMVSKILFPKSESEMSLNWEKTAEWLLTGFLRNTALEKAI